MLLENDEAKEWEIAAELVHGVQNDGDRWGRFAITAFAIVFLLFGISGAFSEITIYPSSLSLPQVDALTEGRTMFGGVCLSTSAFLAYCSLKPNRVPAALTFLTLFFGIGFILRSTNMFMEGATHAYTWFNLGFELFGAMLCLFLLRSIGFSNEK